MEVKKNWEHNDLCVGIDLGTTNSVLAIVNVKPSGAAVSKVLELNRAVEMYSSVGCNGMQLTNQRYPTLPSCIYYREEKNFEPLVGDFAKRQYPLRPHLVAKSIKSQMGKTSVEGLSQDIPDKTPAAVSARILKHMIKEASKMCRCEITDAVITVPANFDPSMCRATRDAAELAGIQVRDEDGNERPILLSEPNAVIYDLINQIHNGEISSHVLDLSTKKRVMVFDLGGGTLDITLHEIRRRDTAGEVLKVDEIATNRYTLLGGDDFDRVLAEEMYKRYIKQYEKHPEIQEKLRHQKSIIMPQLKGYAENLKLELNQRCQEDYHSGWDDEEEVGAIAVGGNMGGIGYAYSDNFTKEEVEKIFATFMADSLVFEDYKRLEEISGTGNIIYPILDVLHKAADKMVGGTVSVDAVIVNGGMSKYYMVIERLERFFGFEPIETLDLDQAVARGAAVYHYYLHQYAELTDDMRLLGTETKSPEPVIEWGKSILNDSLYLGMKNGGIQEIIPTGAELPYSSERMVGFEIEPGQDRIAIPIKSRGLDGVYRTIASGNITLKQKYTAGAYVAFVIRMDSNKVITMQAWTSRDEAGNEKLEEGRAEIMIDDQERNGARARVIAPSGSELKPRDEVNNLLQLCQNYDKQKKNVQEKSELAKRISACVKRICGAGNKGEFAREILAAFSMGLPEETRQRLFTISRKMAEEWTEAERNRLSEICLAQLGPALCDIQAQGPKVSTNIQAIYALGVCGKQKHMKKLETLHGNSKYLQACLYAHAKTRTELSWLLAEMDKDLAQAQKKRASNLQFSSYAAGVALRKEGAGHALDTKAEEKVVRKLTEGIRSGSLEQEALNCCILALGWIGDQRKEISGLDGQVIQEAMKTIHYLEDYYPLLTALGCGKARKVAIKMLEGEALNDEEEQFLLKRLEQ